MIDHYVLDADHKLRSAGLFEWAAFFEDAEARRVGADVVGDVRVSTVFLGIDHSWGAGPPLYFETMVFGGTWDQECDRYSTWDEAAAGHAETVRRLSASLSPWNDVGP